MLAPCDPPMLEWIEPALAHTDYFLPGEEQLLLEQFVTEAPRR